MLVASQALNDLTGYSAIEAIKAANAALEADVSAAQRALRSARQTYKDVNTRRAATQREITGLLARKDSWGPGDLERFTALYRQDHEVEAAVAAASGALADAEARETALAARLNAGILHRYHEEQIWSDRIRRQSTWGTWGLMAVNVVIFIAFQFVAEPWRRGRLVAAVADAERAVLEDVSQELHHLRDTLAPLAASSAPVPAPTPTAAAAAAATQTTGTADATATQHQQTTAVSWNKDVVLNPSRWPPISPTCSATGASGPAHARRIPHCLARRSCRGNRSGWCRICPSSGERE